MFNIVSPVSTASPVYNICQGSGLVGKYTPRVYNGDTVELVILVMINFSVFPLSTG